jgi:hypothetical protein
MKQVKTRVWKLLGAAAIAVSALAAPSANASLILTFSTSNWFGDVMPPVNATPFASATFTNSGTELGQNVVMLSLNYFGTIPGDDGNALISEWSFNSNNLASISSISHDSGQGAGATTAVSSNAFKADGTGGFFDILIDFHPGGPLTEQHTGLAVFKILGSGIDEMDFNSLSFDGNPFGRVGAIHVQSWGPEGDSLWIGGGVCDPRTTPELCDGGGGEQEIPEPGTLAILGAGLLGLAYSRRYRTK